MVRHSHRSTLIGRPHSCLGLGERVQQERVRRRVLRPALHCPFRHGMCVPNPWELQIWGGIWGVYLGYIVCTGPSFSSLPHHVRWVWWASCSCRAAPHVIRTSTAPSAVGPALEQRCRSMVLLQQGHKRIRVGPPCAVGSLNLHWSARRLNLHWSARRGLPTKAGSFPCRPEGRQKSAAPRPRQWPSPLT
jgi:hypothetical protein